MVTDNGKNPSAPYISFNTLKTICADMKEHLVVPSRIDRSVFPSLSGGVIGQLLPALKFLKLTDDSGVPTAQMHSLVETYGTDQWPEVLGKIIRASYVPMFQMNLEIASSRQFDEKFRETYAGAEEVGRKSKAFFLSAAQAAGIKISAYITKGRKTRATPTKKRAPKQNGNGLINTVTPGDHNPPPPPTSKLPSEVLLGYFDADMSDTEQSAVWTLLKYFKAKGK